LATAGDDLDDDVGADVAAATAGGVALFFGPALTAELLRLTTNSMTKSGSKSSNTGMSPSLQRVISIPLYVSKDPWVC
jgi:hypothetical protein